ncbi:MAG TPA: ABC transporter substrate-binding protein, partial [Candidatus Dormibacteraeota bacterium]
MIRHRGGFGAGLRAAVAGLCAAAIAGGCVGGGGPGPGGSRGTVRVALIDVFSGTSPYASQGAYLQNSLQIEIDAMNADGGLLGSRVELVSIDDQLSLATTADQMRRVAADRSIRLLVGPSFAGMYLAAKPLVDQVRLPNCLTNMAADDLMQGARYSFRAQAQDHASVPALLGYVQHGTQLKKIGLIAEEDGVGQSFDQQLSGQAARFGLQYLGAAFAPATGDQKAQVQQIIKQGAEGVVLSNNP